MTSLARQNPTHALDKAFGKALPVPGILLLLILCVSHSPFGIPHFLQPTTAGLLSSRANPFRTQTVTGRDGAGRILTQVVTAGSATPLSETNTWLADSRLDTYSAARDGAWNELRAYGYDARGQVLTETFAPGPGATATLNYTFSANKLGIRTAAKVGAGGNTNWYFNATQLNTLGRVAQFSDNTGTRTVPTSGASFGAASVKLVADGVPGPTATHPGWQDTTGNWTANLQLTPGLHTLTARGVHPSGWLSAPATSSFTVTGTPQTIAQGFDAVGNITSRTWSGGKAQALTWDAFGRLTKVVQTGVEPFTHGRRHMMASGGDSAQATRRTEEARLSSIRPSTRRRNFWKSGSISMAHRIGVSTDRI
ncbi:MAG: hypothetical protein WC076_09310 [Terrimicrobiaceae bacterium]|nr:hypothetical protein [Terrimicrobiaceae bacterium]